MSRFHPVYRENVLMPDYRFARQHLAEHFLDAMTAHVLGVARLPDAHVRAHAGDIARLLAALAELREAPPPDYAEDVPDLYFAYNRQLEARLGEGPVSFLRLGLSRNDLDMTVYKLRTREMLLGVIAHLCALRAGVLKQAEAHLATVLIAQTHHQPGQPTTVAHYLAAIDSALGRDLERLFECFGRLNTCPLGAAALAGSSHGLDRHFSAEVLGFDAPVANTYDAVASADWQVEFVTRLQNLSLTLSRFVHDLIHWTTDGRYVLGDGLVQGSSIMPQKRNPVALEHARTRLSRTLGSSQMVLYSSHNIPYTDLNDIGPDIQGALVSLVIQLDGGLTLLAACLENSRFDTAKLEAEARQSDTTATELADELTRRHGLSFQSAHAVAGALVRRVAEGGRVLQDATPEDLASVGGPETSAEDLAAALSPRAFVLRRDGYGGPAPERVAEHLRRSRQMLDENLVRLTELQNRLAAVRRTLSSPAKEPA